MKNPLYFRIYADFEAGNGKDNSHKETKHLIFINKTQYLTDIV